MLGSGRGLSAVRSWLRLGRPRGVSVPFSTPALQMARVCDDERDGLIAILRDFASTGASYIVPWNNLPSVVSMTESDLALHHAVQENRATSPEAIRAVVRSLTLSGVFGADAKSREVERETASRMRNVDLELVLTYRLLCNCGVPIAPAPVGQRNIQDATAAVAAAEAALEMSRKNIHKNLVSLASILMPVGLVEPEGSTSAGWLRALHGEIVDFANNLTGRMQTVPQCAAADLASIAGSASQVAELSGVIFRTLDSTILDVAGTIKRWKHEAPVLRHVIDQLTLILDEWPAVMNAVHEALHQPPDVLIREIHVLRAVVPRPPSQKDLTT